MSRSVDKDGFPAYVTAWENRIGAFLELREPELWPAAGLPFAVKDNIAVKGFGLTCASKLLESFRATYTATAVKRLQSAGAVVIGKTNMDEFGMGSSTDNSALKRTNNPWDDSRVAGGSSGGSAAAVAAGLVPFALGSDTGGSVRQPAAFCGVVGLKPTYGAVSRYGLVAYASSLETIGVLADSVGRARDVFRIIQGPDPMDQTTAAARLVHGAWHPVAGNKKVLAVLDPVSLVQAIRAVVRGAALVSKTRRDDNDLYEVGEGGVQEDAQLINLLEEEVLAGFSKAVDAYRDLGYEIREVTIPSLAYSVPVYYTIATAEASANLARFDGIRYGKRPEWAENPEDLIDKTRAMGFGSEVKLRILLGTFVLRSGFQDRYYLRAQQLRKQITREFYALFSGKDGPQALLMPVFPTRAFGRAVGDKGGAGKNRGAGGPALSSFAQKAADLFTCPANLAGLPALTFPASVEGGLPVGVQLLGAPFSEELICSIAAEYEADHPIPHPEGFQSYWR
ncbi:amidase family protein [Gracilinema caldarium]|uniref:Glutamyl-tRNA(Gln) amidotransferase subunit A n=1 Tax=Gracilinema caldarium (strain ATCC 51460 / DSM 7334 / H1) TaxID=744872 RepID=F8F2M3_GRAC1|nr:amidase family protein [Gracilinema caldarium]AEJ19138.1 Glutamyl-tRNA(Gln) amidotransferase subunit A [Gracilinema caldarium DSM 7334]